MPPDQRGTRMEKNTAFDTLVHDIRTCTLCSNHLPFAPNPVVRLKPSARILVVGQAPGTKVHATGIPWNDQSGDKLRQWLGVGRETFYNEDIFAIMPMGFCYPGKGKSKVKPEAQVGAGVGRSQGWRSFDLPPRKECAPLWHAKVRSLIPELKLVLLVGSYAIRYYLHEKANLPVRDLVRNTDFARAVFLPLVHPSPRNKLWLKQNPWFETDVVSQLRWRVHALIR